MILVLALLLATAAPAAEPAMGAARAARPLATAPTPAARDTTVTTVIVVRHAEKDTDWAGSDPPLSEAGRARAAALAHALADAHVDAIYATHFVRARATAEPLAALTRDSIEVVDQDHPDALAARIWNRDRGRTVLIVGHSDTVPAIVRSLGGAMDDLASGQFDALIVITRRGDQPPQMVRLRYGAP
jgi:phosphohistidine phosphatase SixA